MRRFNPAPQGHHNLSYQPSESKSDLLTEKPEVNRLNHDQFDGLYKNNEYDSNFFEPFFSEQEDGLSEFNASSFDATVIDARLKAMPYLTIRNRPKELEKITEESDLDLANTEPMPKTRSLLNFADADFNNTEVVKSDPKTKSISLNYINYLEKPEKNPENQDNFTRSLDRKIIKNKNLKILKKLSPFFSKKPIEEINIYQINPPRCQHLKLNINNLDNQLNKVYSHRGMYIYDEKTKKTIFYPPEFFNKTDMKKFYSRMDSYGSSVSQSSVDNDSEDIRHISDVAL